VDIELIGSQPEEADLVQNALEGDPAAWDTLIRQHQEPVFRIAYLILGDAHAAEDVAQETFIRAYQNLTRFDTTRPLRPWLLRISSNQARNARRSIGRYWKALQNAFRLAESNQSTFQTAEVDHVGEYQELWEAIQKLSAPDQQIIYYRYLLDIPVSETALALNIAEGTVKSRLSRALSRLRDVISQEFPWIEEVSEG
jgi:RNA polymerase sigma factor (sigma-70 family)